MQPTGLLSQCTQQPSFHCTLFLVASHNMGSWSRLPGHVTHVAVDGVIIKVWVVVVVVVVGRSDGEHAYWSFHLNAHNSLPATALFS